MCKLCDAEGALLGENERVILENKEDGHNKMYTHNLEEVDGGYSVMGRWGPIGKWQKSQRKSWALSMSEARRILHDLLTKKLRKGYEYRVCAEDARVS
jgi:predicted DNA-binding WGR domain protein